MNPADGTSPRCTWLDLADSAVRDPRVRRDLLIALAMVLITIVLSAWLLSGTPVWLTIGGVVAGTGAGWAARRRSLRRAA